MILKKISLLFVLLGVAHCTHTQQRTKHISNEQKAALLQQLSSLHQQINHIVTELQEETEVLPPPAYEAGNNQQVPAVLVQNKNNCYRTACNPARDIRCEACACCCVTTCVFCMSKIIPDCIAHALASVL